MFSTLTNSTFCVKFLLLSVNTIIIPLQNGSACLSVHQCVRVSISEQNTSFSQSTGGGIESHLPTALVLSSLKVFYLLEKKKKKVAKMSISLLKRIENPIGIGENAG